EVFAGHSIQFFYARHVNGGEYERNAQRRNWVDLPADGMVRGAWFDKP
ncbi:unnamed protein product, partial [marine sediment metagenome]